MLLPLLTARKVGLPGIATPLRGSTRSATMLDVPSKSNGIEHTRKKLRLEFAGRSRLRQDVDDDTADLIGKL